MPAGDIHVIDGLKYQVISTAKGSLLKKLHPNVSDCEFCSFGGPWPFKCKFPRTEPEALCLGHNFLLKLEEQNHEHQQKSIDRDPEHRHHAEDPEGTPSVGGD